MPVDTVLSFVLNDKAGGGEGGYSVCQICTYCKCSHHIFFSAVLHLLCHTPGNDTALLNNEILSRTTKSKVIRAVHCGLAYLYYQRLLYDHLSVKSAVRKGVGKFKKDEQLNIP